MYIKMLSDGEFFMEFEDFKKYFDNLEVGN